ncbi:MAG: ABC transporter permease [Rubrobacter sp.]|nr:ABC transporter permease [Rubrobacter sp.]
MVGYIIKRLVFMVVALFVVASATFFLIQLLPGSPFNDAKLSDEALAQLEAKYGLDDPMPVQYARYMGNIVQGDLGDSFYFEGQPVTSVILDRIPVSAFLGVQALIIGTAVGMPLGVIAAMRHNGFTDYMAVLISILGYSVPSFVLGPLLQYFVGVKLGWLPIAFFESWAHSILPTLALAAIVIATVARFVRTEMLEVLGQDYVTLATAKGLSKVAVVYKHVIRNSLIPLVTVIAPLAVSILTGSLVIEQIFAVPGLGEMFVTSIRVNDYFVITGLAMFFSLFFILALLVQDILYGVIDPRIRVSGAKE